eukprot:2273288-Rhodomonas_salina.3
MSLPVLLLCRVTPHTRQLGSLCRALHSSLVSAIHSAVLYQIILAALTLSNAENNLDDVRIMLQGKGETIVPGKQQQYKVLYYSTGPVISYILQNTLHKIGRTPPPSETGNPPNVSQPGRKETIFWGESCRIVEILELVPESSKNVAYNNLQPDNKGTAPRNPYVGR